MRDDEDERPARGKKSASKPVSSRSGGASSKSAAKDAGKPSKLVAGKVSKSAEPPVDAKSKPKPKMRLVNGKLVPVDEPGLF